MKDRFNREIDYMRISVTDRCNLRCKYCMPETGIIKASHEEILRDEEIVELVKEAVKLGVKKIRITGGEPLVRNGIYELISKIKDIKEIEEITLTTNGILLEGNVKKLKDAGVNRINLSLDTLKPVRFMEITRSLINLNYLKLIQELKENDLLPIKINTVLLKGINDDEIKDFIKLSQDEDIIIRFIELMPIGHLNFNWEKHYLNNNIVLKTNPRLKLYIEDKNTIYYKDDCNGGLIGLINPISHKFCHKCNRIRVTSDGKIKPCLHYDEELSIKGLSSTKMKLNLIKAIKNKPKDHNIEEENYKEIDRAMNRIGG